MRHLWSASRLMCPWSPSRCRSTQPRTGISGMRKFCTAWKGWQYLAISGTSPCLMAIWCNMQQYATIHNFQMRLANLVGCVAVFIICGASRTPPSVWQGQCSALVDCSRLKHRNASHGENSAKNSTVFRTFWVMTLDMFWCFAWNSSKFHLDLQQAPLESLESLDTSYCRTWNVAKLWFKHHCPTNAFGLAFAPKFIGCM